MKKLVGLSMVVVFSITTYNTEVTSYNGFNLLWLLSLLGLIFGIIFVLSINNNSEDIAEKIVSQIFKKNPYYYNRNGGKEIFKLKGNIRNHQKFSSYESDSIKEELKIFSYDPSSGTFTDCSSYVGLKRKTVIYNDYLKPKIDWVDYSHKDKIFFIVRETLNRELLSFNLKDSKTNYKDISSKTIIEVYSCE